VTRVCVIGNSHLNAVKLGWELLRPTGFQPTFFGSHANALRELRVEGVFLVPASEDVAKWLSITSGGKTRIDLTEFDRVLLVGLGSALFPFLKLYSTHRLAEHAGPEWEFGLVTEACLQRTVHDRLSAGLAFSTARKIRRISQIQVLLIPDPIPSEPILQSEEWGPLWSHREACRFFFQTYSNAMENIARDVGISVLRQPEETLRDGITKLEFSEGSTRLHEAPGVRHPEGEFHHMNARYGAVVLKAAFPLLM
jgi:hypothetical protein